MSDDDVKQNSDPLDKIDYGHPLDRTFQQLGQVSYSYMVDQNQAGMPSNTVASDPAYSYQPSTQSEPAPSFVHPSAERQVAESKIDPGARYVSEMTARFNKPTSQSDTSPPLNTSQGTFEGAIERQTGVGFSSRFNFARSLDCLFKRLDVNRDGRVSKSELDAALSDASLSGDDELLLILLLRHINDIARQSPGEVSGSSLSVTYQSIRNYRGWQQYFG